MNFDSSISTGASYNGDPKDPNKMCSLEIHNREHHSKYSKDDIWAISTSKDFQVSFLTKSTFYGPFSNGNIEVAISTTSIVRGFRLTSLVKLVALSSDDSTKADRILKAGEPITVFAFRIMNASSEFSMISNLLENMEGLSILPSVLGMREQASALTSLVHHEKTDAFMKLARKVCQTFKLNSDQAR
jgi:hypothetical protein